MDGATGSTTGTSLQTGTKGDFELSVDNFGIHALEINYLGLISLSDLFIVKDRQPYEGLVLTLNGNLTELLNSEGEENERSDSEGEENDELFLDFSRFSRYPNV